MTWIDLKKAALKTIWICSFLQLSRSQKSSAPDLYPEYNILPSHDMHKQTIKIIWVNSTTSSIAIRWEFINEYRPNGTFFGTKIEYFVKDGKFTSDLFLPEVNEYILEYLQPATVYTICVDMVESDPSVTTHLESKYHSECLNISTIPYVRKDSILVLLLTLGYFCFMGSLGYSQWRRKLNYVRKKYSRDDCSYTEINDSSRWIDLQERSKSNNRCSIEDAVRL